MINRLLLSLIAVCWGVATATAQTQQVSGTVTDAAGAPVVGATVLVEGTMVGATTDASGRFTVKAPEEGKLNISFIGYQSQQIDIAGRTDISVTLEEDTHTIDDVVVTAMGITRSEKTLGYSVSKVESDELTKARDGNVLNSLSGKVAGVNISTSSGTAGGSSRIIIRGQSSLGSSGQPLFVIDGMPVSNQSYDPGNAGTALSGAAVDPGNRMGDIAGDDIESINILKGAAATALYGARAKDGAVIITTKKGSRNQSTCVTINSTMRFESILRLPDFQNTYAQGNPTTGNYAYGNQNGWGPRIEGQTVKNFLGQDVQLRAYKNNVKDFYETGKTYINSISVAGGDEKNDFRLGLTSHNQTGIIPNNEYDKYNVSFNGGRKFNDKLEARISFTYAHSTSEGRPAQGSNDVNVIVPQINSIPRTTDIAWLRDNWITETGSQMPVDETGKTGNLYWTVNKNRNTGTVDRMFGSAVVSYKPVKGLTITNNLGTDFFEEQRRQVWASGTVGLPDGQFTTNNITYRQINNDLMISYETNFSDDWSFKAMMGHNINQNFTKYLDVTAKNLLVADIYSYSNAESVITTNNQSKSRLIGVYGEVDLGYKDIVYLSITGRNDWSSTMPKSHRSYFYPSISTGFVFTELIPRNDILSFGKLRLSYANVGSDTVPYALDFLYTPESSVFLQYVGDNSIPHGGLLAYMAPATFPDPDLEPQNQSSFEIGTDLRFFNGRIRLDATYYYNKTTKNIVRLDVANSTGFFYMRKNAGTITNEGVEILAGFTPVKTKNFAWDLDVNFASNRQLVKELDPSISNYSLSSGFNSLQVKAAVGEPFSLYGTYWLTDDEGNYIIKEDGTRAISSDTKNLGKVSPDWTMGITNTFRYRNLTLSFLVDVRYGGVLYSGTVSDLRVTGMAAETVGDNRADIVDKGVVQTTDDAGNVISTPNTKAISPYQFWSNNYSTSVSEANIFDATYVKLRELTLSYQLPQEWFKNCFIGSLAVGIEGRNLWLMKSNVPHIDPETNIFGPSGVGSGVEYGAIPSTRSWGFNIRLTF